MPETMRWEGNCLMLGDDELARIVDRVGLTELRMTCFNNARVTLSRRAGWHDKAKAEAIKRIRQGRKPLLNSALEAAALAERIVNADFPKE